MKLWKLVCPVGLIFVLGACSNLKDKAVFIQGDVQGFKVTTDVNANNGSPMPLPKVDVGFGSFTFLDMPLISDSGRTFEDFTYYSKQKSIWSDTPASVTYINIKGGKDVSKDGVKVNGRITIKE